MGVQIVQPSKMLGGSVTGTGLCFGLNLTGNELMKKRLSDKRA